MSEDEWVSLLDRPPPPWAQLRLLVLMPGAQHSYDRVEWVGALVVVEHGGVEVESLDGSRWPFEHGSVLCLARTPLRAVHNPGPDIAVLSALSRRDGSNSSICNQTTKGSREEDHLS